MKTNVKVHKGILMLAALAVVVGGIFTGYYCDVDNLNISFITDGGVFEGLIIICLLLSIGSVTHDVLAIKLHKRKVSDFNYQIFDINVNQIKTLRVLFAILSLYFLGQAIISSNHTDLLLFSFLIVDIVFLSYQIQSKNELREIGIIFRGQYHRWNKVQSYQWENGGNTVVFRYMRRFLFFKYNQPIKCRVIPEQKEEIDELLSKKILSG
jgi:hypothetical protein